MTPEISIIVPVYNVDKYIEKCIQSIQNQTFRNWELLLVDDGSLDSSGEICDLYSEKDCRIKVIHKINGGVSSARNKGIVQAQGNYLLFVDGDDWVEQNMLETMLSQIKVNHTDACFCSCYFRNENKVLRATFCEDNKRKKTSELVKKHLKYEFLASPCLGLIYRNKVKECFFDEEIYTLEDWEYNFRMLTCLDLVTIISTPFYHYREVEGSASKSSLNHRKMSCFLIPQKVENYIIKMGLPLEKDAKNIPIFLINHMLVLLANGKYVDEEASMLKRISKEKLWDAFTTRNVKLKQKIYILMTSISPKLFCWAYHVKYRNGDYHEK